MNVNVTDVAWSLPQTYVVDNGLNMAMGSNTSKLFGPSHGVDGITAGMGSNDTMGMPVTSGAFGDSYDASNTGLVSPSAVESEQHSSHYPSFIKRIYMGSSQNRKLYAAGDATQAMPVDDTSVVAAAGSNGVIVAWHARSALLGGDNSPSNNAGGGRGWGLGGGGRTGGNDNATSTSQVSSAASIGQPEAVFLGHARAVNRLAWHPTGRRPYLLLSASQVCDMAN